jgi:long-chain acyl-CoA synthetase
MCLTELLDDAAGRWPLKPALIDGDITVSYAGLKEGISDWAARLKSLGVTSGDRVGLSLPNCITYVAVTFALWKLGAIVVPIPGECADEEVATIATALQLEALMSSKSRGHSLAIQAGVFFTNLGGTPRPVTAGHGQNLAFIRFTSGTSNERKGVALSHETVRDRVRAANKALRIGAEDTVMWCLPMSHHFLVTIVLYLSHGASIVLARQVLAGSFLDLVNRHRGTVLYAAPFHYGLLARDVSGADLSSVRLAVSTTCALSKETAESFHGRFGLPLVQALGIIEVGLVCVNVDDPLGRWDSVGRPLPDFAVNIFNPDAEGCGEVRVAGPGIFDAYAEPWTPREQVMPDGWFATGDMGRVDADGFVYLLSRRTAVINLAGRKVFPEEIEAVLDRHPAVRESRVYGAPHPRLGEVIEAEVALKFETAPEELRDFCRTRIGADKIPSRIRIVQSVARTPVTGKLRRSAVFQPTA